MLTIGLPIILMHIMNELPLHRKLGYDHMLEMREIESRLRKQGLFGVNLYFESVRAYDARHNADLTYRQRQDAAKARGEKWVSSNEVRLPDDLLRKALEEIRDGHNDPRTLARDVLAATA